MHLPKFLDLYLTYTEGNETPELMHLWAGLSVLAGVAEKRIWVPVGFHKEGLNLYVILLGPPGGVAKSTALKMAKDLLNEGGFNIMEGAVTKEKIADEMTELVKHFRVPESRVVIQTPVTYIANEIFTVLSSGMDMIKFLTDIWNEENWTYKTKTSGTYEIPNVCFNLLGATTPQWFSSNVFCDLSSSGFLARCIIVYESLPRGAYPFFTIGKKQRRAKKELLEMIEQLKIMYGPIKFDEEAAQAYTDWYLAQEPPLQEDHRMASYLERKRKIFLLKVSGLVALGDGRILVKVEDVETAIKLFRRTEPKMRIAFMTMGDNNMIPLVIRVVAYLRANHGKARERSIVQFLARDTEIDVYKRLREQMVILGVVKLVREGGRSFVILNENEAGPFLEAIGGDNEY